MLFVIRHLLLLFSDQLADRWTIQTSVNVLMNRDLRVRSSAHWTLDSVNAALCWWSVVIG